MGPDSDYRRQHRGLCCNHVGFQVSHFTLSELIRSEIAVANGIDNAPGIDVINQLRFTMAGLERLRAYLGFPIKIRSGYRCVKLNDLVGGAKNSQHLDGAAADITCPAFGDPKRVAGFLLLKMAVLGIDQLILEGTWIHVSFTLEPRYQALTLLPEGKYTAGIVL